jgi:hypothetical protein
MEIKKGILPVVLLLLMPLLCFAQEQNEDWHTVKLLGDDWIEGSATETAQGLVESEFEKNLEEEGSFYILTDDENNQFIIQEFKWEASEYVYMYRFVIERKNDNGVYVEYDAQDVEENFADCMLIAGDYRYKIGLYNFLGNIEVWTDWIPVTVRKAIKPEITDVSPDYVYVDTGDDVVLTVKGNDLSESPKFRLTNMESGLQIPAIVIDKDLAKNLFTIQISGFDFEEGKYTVTARNEGGLLSHFSPVSLVNSSPFDLTISVMATNPLATSNTIIEDYWYWLSEDNGIFNTFLNPNFHARITFIPFKGKTSYFGFSLGVSSFFWINYRARPEDGSYDFDYCIESELSTAYLCFNYQRPLGGHFVFDAHIGAGASLLSIDIVYRIGTTEQMRSVGLNARAGVELQWFPWRHIYLELNADYVYNLYNGLSIQYVEPGLAIGWRF